MNVDDDDDDFCFDNRKKMFQQMSTIKKKIRMIMSLSVCVCVHELKWKNFFFLAGCCGGGGWLVG